jgi:predicted transcriptional regulator YheO
MAVRTPVPSWLEPHVATCEAIVALFAPYTEVAVHDLRRERLVGIWNPMSARKLGEPSLLDELPSPDHSRLVVGPYGKVLPDGRQVTSVTVALHSAKGAPRGILCISFDRSQVDGMIDLLVRFAAPLEDRPAEPVDKDWREQISLAVDQECRARRLRRDRLTRLQRLELVRALDDRGFFATRNAAAHAGRALGVSRTTVYALLKEARS